MHRVDQAPPLLAALLLTAGIAQARPGDAVDGKFRGDWVPAKAACTSPLKVSIAARAVTFVNGTQRAEFTKLDQCVSCIGRDVQDVTLLSTDQMGDSPWMLTLDASKKRQAVVSADFSNDKMLGGALSARHGGVEAVPMRRRRAGGAQAQDAVARRHHQFGDVADGVDAAAADLAWPPRLHE